MEGSGSRDWSLVPPELLKIINQKLLPYIADLARFRSVCSSWRTAASDLKFVLPSRHPWLMLPYPISPSDLNTRLFFSLSPSSSSSSSSSLASTSSSPPPMKKNVCLHLPELCDKECRGLNFGWLLGIGGGLKTPLFLFNPFTRSQIRLPPLPLPIIWKNYEDYPYEPPPPPTPYYYDQLFNFSRVPDHNSLLLQEDFYMPTLSLAVLSADPSIASSFEILALHGRESRLVSLRPGDREWKPVVDVSGQPCKRFRSLAHCNARFYGIDTTDNLVVCNTSSAPATANVLLRLPNRDLNTSSVYLVGSDSELLLVMRRWNRSGKNIFIVFKLVEGKEGGEKKWVKLNSIGERAIFISEENSIVVSTEELDGCRASCIYYADVLDWMGYMSETSVEVLEFCIEDNKMKKMISCSDKNSIFLWQPCWVHPSL